MQAFIPKMGVNFIDQLLIFGIILCIFKKIYKLIKKFINLYLLQSTILEIR